MFFFIIKCIIGLFLIIHFHKSNRSQLLIPSLSLKLHYNYASIFWYYMLNSERVNCHPNQLASSLWDCRLSAHTSFWIPTKTVVVCTIRSLSLNVQNTITYTEFKSEYLLLINLKLYSHILVVDTHVWWNE